MDDYQDYIYRVDVSDENNMTIGTAANVKTYCSGISFECEGRIKCTSCSGSGKCKHLKLPQVGVVDGCEVTCFKGGRLSNTRVLCYECEKCGMYYWSAMKNCCGDTYASNQWTSGTLGERPKEGSHLKERMHHGRDDDNYSLIRQEEPRCFRCMGQGKVRCDHNINGRHFFCYHNVDDINHKWHYSR
ncbi:MAG: hypothetical protein HFJ54_08860 [Clostridia bacterium]|nr:hypothetical protein [Clostridia bacterium]